MDKSYRIHTKVSGDSVLKVNMKQEFDFLEVLSLKLSQEDSYRLHSSNYGVIVGRVLANEAFGIPNAKVSVFIPRDENDDTDIEALYKYTSVSSTDKEGRRYNLLPDYSPDECYRVVGSFPSKTLVLDDSTYLEVFDKYYRYTTATNKSGDYMIFGVPNGTNEVHVDVDLSDIGILSQKPRDFVYKGYNMNMFDSPSQFRESTSLDSLAQIFSQNKSVYVEPFWGDADEYTASITRCDIEIQYKFEPTCVFMGAIMTDNGSNAIGHDCSPAKNNGMNDQLVAGEGTIEMIRKTPDGLIEEYQINGNQLIDSDGVWCYQIPMNLDYIGTDEYGNIVPTDNPSKGIPTRAQVRFRISKNESPEGSAYHTAKMLVPMNPIFDESEIYPTIKESGAEVERMYAFGSSTPQSCFRDLYWNNVYSVKSYIPRLQTKQSNVTPYYTALKGANLTEDKNQIPFNKLRVDVPFTYMIICILFTIVMYIVYFINKIICVINAIIGIFIRITDIKILGIRPFKWIRKLLGIDYIGCLSLSAGLNDDKTAYYPGCSCSSGLKAADCPSDIGGGCKKSSDRKDLEDAVQRNLAFEYNIIKLDFYNDWLNGAIYMPLWYWKRSRKKKFLFFTIRKAKDTYCNCDNLYRKIRNMMTCAFAYDKDSEELKITQSTINEDEKKWHKNRSAGTVSKHGLIKTVENKDGLKVYYYSAFDATTGATNPTMQISERDGNFPAVRLYATDIILLGNMNEDNLFGLPQLYKSLPSTTANIPPIATVVEDTENTDETTSKKTSDSDIDWQDEDAGTVTTTGMDWGHNGGDAPWYKNGLFMDLSCTYVNTKAKSCINVERLSELGMNLDMSYTMPYGNGSDIKYGSIMVDGFVSKLEMDDVESRAMFATMNHVGFIPQIYQESVNSYTTQVLEENTNYLVPKMQYIYPVDLDGRMQIIMNRYANGFAQALIDDYDDAYVTFRYGAAGSNKDVLGRKRHFYEENKKTPKNNMPLYNNSFYFFFGVNKGSTAIDKFNNKFDAECFQNNKYPFYVSIEKRSMAMCPESYDDDHKDMALPFIKVTLEDIEMPYTYWLYDAKGEGLITSDEMTATTFTIEGYYENGEFKYLSNQLYKLVIADTNGRTVTERIVLEDQPINAIYTYSGLGAKFFDPVRTPREYFCENGFNGFINVEGVNIDGRDFRFSGDVTQLVKPIKIKDSTTQETISGVCVNLTVPAVCSTDASLVLSVTITLVSNDVDYDYDLMPSPAPAYYMSTTNSLCLNDRKLYTEEIYDTSYKRLVFNVVRPYSYTLTVSQACSTSHTNSSDSVVNIANGLNFQSAINTMPLMFMLGTTSNLTEAAGNNFYTTNSAVTAITTAITNVAASGSSDASLRGWIFPNDERMYRFKKFQNLETDYLIWEDYVSISGDFKSPQTKRNILIEKFNTMFALSDGVFVTNDSTPTLRLSANGGVSPILYRAAHPDYTLGAEDGETLTQYVVEDVNTIDCDSAIPNIVGSNFTKKLIKPNGVISGYTTNYTGSSLNDTKFYLNRISYNTNVDSAQGVYQYLGNYMAAFSNDGGYITLTEVNPQAKFQREPWLADPNPSTSMVDVKRKGGKLIGLATDNVVKYVYKQKKSYLRGMFVDRRFDYDLIMIAPIRLQNYEFGIPEIDNDGTWKNARLFGKTYNGIEMSYDNEYNILDAKLYKATSVTSDEYGMVTAATSSNTLEYTYSYLGGVQFSALTHLNKTPGVNRKPYFAEFGNKDLLKLNEGFNAYEDSVGVTSSQTTYPIVDFTRDELTFNFDDEGKLTYFSDRGTGGVTDVSVPANATYVRSDNRLTTTFMIQQPLPVHQCIVVTDDPLAVLTPSVRKLYSYTMVYKDGTRTLYDSMTFFYSSMKKQAAATSYNCQSYLLNHYDLDNPSSTYYCDSDCQYPTVRSLNVFAKPKNSYYFSNIGCSYNMTVEQDEDGALKSYTEPGETTELDFKFTSPIRFTGNTSLVLKSNGDRSEPYTNISFVIANNIDYSFVIKPVEMDGFTGYIRYPRLLSIMKTINDGGTNVSVNTIEYIKKATDYDDLTDRINRCCEGDWKGDTKFTVAFPENTSGRDTRTGKTDNQSFRSRRDGNVASCGNKRMLWNNQEDYYAASDSDNFQLATFTLKNKPSNGDIFTILIDKELIYDYEDGLKRCLRIVEFSEFVDVRGVTVTPVAGYYYSPSQYGGTHFKYIGTEDGVKKFEQHVRFNISGGTDGMNSAFVDYDSLSFRLSVKTLIPEIFEYGSEYQTYETSCYVVEATTGNPDVYNYTIEAILPDEFMLVNSYGSWTTSDVGSDSPPNRIRSDDGSGYTVFQEVSIFIMTPGGIEYRVGGKNPDELETNRYGLFAICNTERGQLEALDENNPILAQDGNNRVSVHFSDHAKRNVYEVGPTPYIGSVDFTWTTYS